MKAPNHLQVIQEINFGSFAIFAILGEVTRRFSARPQREAYDAM